MNRATLAMGVLALAATLAVPADGQTPRGQRRASQPVGAQRTTGLIVGVHTVAAPGVAISGEDVRDDFHTELGGGIGAMVGYEFSPRITAYASIDVAKQGSGMPDLQGSFGLLHLEIGARATLPMANRTTIPYVTAAIGRRALGAHIVDIGNDEEYDATFSGTMLAVGGGVERQLSPTMALDGGISVGVGSFSTMDIDGDEQSIAVTRSNSVRLRVGVVWRP